MLEWLELLEEEKKHERETREGNGDYLAILNHALQVSVRANRPQISQLLLNHGASELANRIRVADHVTVHYSVGIGVRDDEKRTLLHLINGCPVGEDISAMMNMLIGR